MRRPALLLAASFLIGWMPACRRPPEPEPEPDTTPTWHAPACPCLKEYDGRCKCSHLNADGICRCATTPPP
jgi:hypothetical protein